MLLLLLLPPPSPFLGQQRFSFFSESKSPLDQSSFNALFASPFLFLTFVGKSFHRVSRASGLPVTFSSWCGFFSPPSSPPPFFFYPPDRHPYFLFFPPITGRSQYFPPADTCHSGNVGSFLNSDFRLLHLSPPPSVLAQSF